MIKAKEVLKDKFWIVEENGSKVGTLSAAEECYTYSCGAGTQVFGDFNQLKKHLGKITWSTADDKDEKSEFKAAEKYSKVNKEVYKKKYNEEFKPIYDKSSQEYPTHTTDEEISKEITDVLTEINDKFNGYNC